MKRYQVSQVSQKTKNSFNKGEFETRILNKYFSVGTWKLVELRHIILRILFDSYKITWHGTLRQILIFQWTHCQSHLLMTKKKENKKYNILKTKDILVFLVDTMEYVCILQFKKCLYV